MHTHPKAMKSLAAIGLALAFHALPASGQDEIELYQLFPLLSDQLEAYEWWADCAPIGLSINLEQSENSPAIISESTVRNAVESRLRAARLMDVRSLTYLSIDIRTVGNGFSIVGQLNKPMFDLASEFSFNASAFAYIITGVYSESDYLLNALAELMDDFLNNYLRINEPAC